MTSLSKQDKKVAWTRLIPERVSLLAMGGRTKINCEDTLSIPDGLPALEPVKMEEENPFTKSKTIDPEVRAYVYSLVNAVCF